MNLLPRLGGAYRINDKSVVRLGWGRYISPSSKIRDPLGDFVNQYAGFSTSTPAATLAVVAPATGPVPRATLSNPFPNFHYPDPAAIGPVVRTLHQSWQLNWHSRQCDKRNRSVQLRPAVNDRISFSYQREIWAKFVLDFEYFHNHEKNLPYSVDLNMADPSFSYETPKSLFNQSVTNPFFNYLTPDKFPGTLRTQSNITIGALLRPFPQYGVINQTNTPDEVSDCIPLRFKPQRPYAKGVSLLFAYCIPTREDTGVL